jgi:predicted enzyme related to lactoylglutathione lyase
VDTEQPDPEAACRFYGGLFGWTFEEAMPPGAPGSYLIAKLDGRDVAAVGPSSDGEASWNTYIAVDDADAAVAALTAAGGTLLSGPEDAGPGGRTATAADPSGARFRLWQARRRLGAQIANVPGAWNFSNLHAINPVGQFAFYADIFGWMTELPPDSNGSMVRVPGYGDHLAATSDPGIRERHATAPPGFSDAAAGLVTAAPGELTHWQVLFTVADRDKSVATAEDLGATTVSTAENLWTRTALVRDPAGAEFTLSQFTPPAT